MSKLIKNIREKLSESGDVIEGLKNLSGTELNSLLLELFRQRSGDVSPAAVLQQFGSNRFVQPADIDIVGLKETEAAWLRMASEQRFSPIQLAPLAPFASCSAVGHVDQNNVVTALRGTEVVSDATNVLALQIARNFKESRDKNLVLRYATTHRHVRGQYFTNPAYTAHFTVFCIASGGLDAGSFRFELEELKRHLHLLCCLLKTHFSPGDLLIRFFFKGGTDVFRQLLGQQAFENVRCEFNEEPGTGYYHTFQFKIFLKKSGQEVDLADGGMVDWTQKLLANRKQRLLISGIGLELVKKLA